MGKCCSKNRISKYTEEFEDNWNIGKLWNARIFAFRLKTVQGFVWLCVAQNPQVNEGQDSAFCRSFMDHTEVGGILVRVRVLMQSCEKKLRRIFFTTETCGIGEKKIRTAKKLLDFGMPEYLHAPQKIQRFSLDGKKCQEKRNFPENQMNPSPLQIPFRTPRNFYLY